MSRYTIRTVTKADKNWVIRSHVEHYQNEYGFDDSFAVLCREIVDSFLTNRNPVAEQGWIAEENGVAVGCIFCVRYAKDTAQLRLFYLVKEARGHGLGKRLLQTCMQFAKQAGYSDMRLWTHQSHTAATGLYRAQGWRCDGSEEKESFGTNEVVETYVYRF
ncbi:MAG: GNAT family N-acetyltransferase [Roseobacter sp.]|nr:GNAT family N-acetyltransferase [Roseobacter sp.]